MRAACEFRRYSDDEGVGFCAIPGSGGAAISSSDIGTLQDCAETFPSDASPSCENAYVAVVLAVGAADSYALVRLCRRPALCLHLHCSL